MVEMVSDPALIANAGRLAAGDDVNIANIIMGGQLGLGSNYVNIDAATPLVLPPIVPIVTHVPTMFQEIPKAGEILKALVERHAKEISGIDFGLTLEAAATPAGHDGQELQMPTNSKRTQVNPTFVWQELKGNLVWNFIRMWIELIKSPDTQASKLSAIIANKAMAPQLMSFFTMDVMFIQFDETLRPENITDAFFISNMWPQETGMGGWKRTIGQSEMPERSIPFHGIVQHNRSTYEAGRYLARALELHKINYDYATPMATKVESDVADEGLAREVADDLKNFVQL